MGNGEAKTGTTPGKGIRTRLHVCAESEDRRRPTRGDANVELGGELSKTGESPLTEIEWFLADFDQLKLKIPYRNLKFGQNKSCRGQKGLQLCFWAKIDSKPELRTKTRSNAANSKVTLET